MVLVKSKEKMFFEGFSIFMLIILFFIIITTTVNTDAPFYMVLFGFAPTILTIVIGILIYEEILYSKTIIWLTPFVLSALFLIVGNSDRNLRENLDVSSLAAINILFSAIYLALFFMLLTLISKQNKERKHHEKETSFTPPLVVQTKPTTIKEYIASIEDKSKALNFAIGRVYNKYHGGTKELREIISIKPEWYNEFSEAITNEQNPDKKRLIQILNNFENRLELLEKTEREVLGEKHLVGLKNLQRNKTGNDKILDVLANNDKDPVGSYHEGAKEFCEKLKQELQK